MKYDLAICLPGIRNDSWEKLYSTVVESIGPYSFEMIIVGPYPPNSDLSNRSNFKFFKDYGYPTRCAQIATMLAESEYMMWASDDGYFTPNSIKECLDLFKNKDKNINDKYKNISDKDEIIIQYTEGTPEQVNPNFHPDEYWNAKTHGDLRLNGIKDNFKIAPVGMLKLDYFRWLGGWNCKYEHLNMCCHDLAFRVQNNGGNLYLSPSMVMRCTWSPGTIEINGIKHWISNEHIPIHRAYFENDLQLFREMWSSPQNSDKIRMDYFNWNNAPAIWSRRFGKRVLVTGSDGLIGDAIRKLIKDESTKDQYLQYDFCFSLEDLRYENEMLKLFNEDKPHFIIHTQTKVGGIGRNLIRYMDAFNVEKLITFFHSDNPDILQEYDTKRMCSIFSDSIFGEDLNDPNDLKYAKDIAKVCVGLLSNEHLPEKLIVKREVK